MKSPQALDWREWDFECCPEEHLAACYFYEYSRAVARTFPNLGQCVAEFRAALPACHTWENFTQAVCDRHIMSDLRARRVFADYIGEITKAYTWPEWPLQPFLGISEVERSKRIKREPNASTFGPAELPSDKEVSLSFNLNLPDSELLRQFRDEIKAWRGMLGVKQRKSVKVSGHIRSWLLALGALRIRAERMELSVHDGTSAPITPTEAAAMTKASRIERRRPSSQLRPLFTGKASWSRAEATARTHRVVLFRSLQREADRVAILRSLS